MRALKRLLILLPLLLGLCACAASEGEEGAVVWYAVDVSGWDSSASALESVPYGGAMEVESMFAALLAAPERESGVRSPLPADTRLLSWRQEGDLLYLDLSAPYGTLEGFDRTLASYCLTLTLCQLDGVERLSLTVEGEPLAGGYWGELAAEQALLSGAEERPVEVSADLYFPRAAGRGLGVEARVFQLTEGDVLVEQVMRALLGGPEDEELSSAIPEGTEIRSVRLEDGVCVVDLSQALLDGLPEGEEQQTLLIYSIVDTLGNLSSVDSVILQVEGAPLTRLGEVSLPGALEPDFGLAE